MQIEVSHRDAAFRRPETALDFTVDAGLIAP